MFFPSGPHSLFGVLHEPRATEDRPGFVFCHPFGEEKLWSHRVFVTFARLLAERGYPVLRFDYMGNGDSTGEFSLASLTTACSDVRAAVDLLLRRTGVSSLSLLGLRLGASIASLVAEEVPGVNHLVLWAPIVDGSRYMQDQLRTNVTTQMALFKEIRQDRTSLVSEMQAGKTVNVDGYEMTMTMFAEVSAVRLAAGRKRHQGQCLVVHVTRQPSRQAADLEQLAASYGDCTIEFAEEEPFWKEIPRFYDQAPNLFGVTLGWLERR